MEEQVKRKEKRDVVKIQGFKELGRRIIVIWECELKGDNQSTRLDRLFSDITQEM